MSSPNLSQSGSKETISDPGSQTPSHQPLPPESETPVDSGQPEPDAGGSTLGKLQSPPDPDQASGEEDNPAEGEERTAKTKPEYGRHFSLYSTLSKMRGAKKCPLHPRVNPLPKGDLPGRPLSQSRAQVSDDAALRQRCPRPLPLTRHSPEPLEPASAAVHGFTLRTHDWRIRPPPPELADPAALPSPSQAVGEQSPLEEPGLLLRLQAERSVLGRKVPQLSEQLRVRLSERQANAALYLRLVAAADAARAPRLQRAFEHKDRHLRSAVGRLQARLEQCIRRQAELDRHIALLQAQALGPTPEDRARALGPTPDYQALGPTPEDRDQAPAPGPASDDSGGPLAHSSGSSEGRPLSYLTVLEELTEVREGQLGLELGLQGVAGRCRQDFADLKELLREEWRRSSQLQAQLNDLMDLHQNEVINLKSDLASLEEKIAYQSYESSRDIWEVLESFQSKLQRLEQLQQVSQGEGLDSRSTRELLGKSMNLLLMVFAVVLMLMSTLSALVLPFIRTRARTVTTCTLALLLLWVWHNWDSFSLPPASTLLHRWP
ncbi:transmembrane and coiled-coil domains protein 1-like [Pristis pectinata]|uniref:transmembrane and coiled-coil domains protein 1-like n=1 Tax=Pristis pectinata TaxID=685728 RepID=UPI00223D8371|nr:transmembrane and coiled-coil domains protein 1-like [Pristis pectinata]